MPLEDVADRLVRNLVAEIRHGAAQKGNPAPEANTSTLREQ